MAHDVLVSYSSKDKTVADAVVAGLEQDGLRCWVAPRDVLAGTTWGGAIVDAIEACHVMVLILSESSNGSRQVLREVQRAVESETIILPFRIEAIDPSGAMAYFLALEHWLDALAPPLEQHINRQLHNPRFRGLHCQIQIPTPVIDPGHSPEPALTQHAPDLIQIQQYVARPPHLPHRILGRRRPTACGPRQDRVHIRRERRVGLSAATGRAHLGVVWQV